MTFPDISLFLACNRITHAKQKGGAMARRKPPGKANTNETHNFDTKKRRRIKSKPMPSCPAARLPAGKPWGKAKL